jgi:hypothetical protein
MLVFEKRWTLELDDKDETYLRTIVDLGALAQERCKLTPMLAIHPEHPNVTFEEQTVLEVALLVGLRVLARDLERELGTPLEGGDGEDDDHGGKRGGGKPPADG